MMRRIHGIILGALLWSASAHADDASDLEQLLEEPVVTTASKSAEVSSAAPGTASTITAEDLRRYGIRTLDEALDYLSLGFVTQSALKDPNVGARGVMLPGDQGNHVLLLINGHPVNEPLFGAARFGRGLGIPMELVDHIEVILGPGSVLYGSNAMLGIVNVVTLPATDLRRPRIWADSEIGKSWRAGAAAAWETRLGRSSLAFTAGLEYYRQDGPHLRFTELNIESDPIRFTNYRSRRDLSPDGRWGGLATQSPTAEVPTVFANVVLGDLHVDVHAWTSKRSAPSEEVASLERTYFNDPTQYEVDRHAWFDARYRIPISRKLDFIPRLYGDTFNYERYSNTSWGSSCLSGAVEACRAHLVGASQWAGAEAQLRYDWLGNGRLVTLLGADGRLRHVAQKSDLSNYDTGEALVSSVGVLDASDRIVGAYVQQVWQPTRPLMFNVGSRVDYDPRFDVVGSPRLAGTYQPWRGSTLKVVFAEAFRAPTWGETSSSAYGSQLPAQDLVPERVRSVESSFEQRFGTHRLMFGTYRSWWKELIELRLLTRSELEIAQQEGRAPLVATAVNQYQNITRIEHYGFNAGYDGDSLGHRLRFGVNVTAASARRAYDSQQASGPILVSPHYFGNARVSYEPPGNWPGVALAGQLLGSRAADGLSRGFASQPYVPGSVQLRATLFGRAPWVQGLSYRLGATWASIDRAAFTIGPNSSGNVGFASPGSATVPDNAIYAPVDTFRVAVGLQYEIGR